LIVLVQTLWFMIQCIARGVQHLPLTELEVITLAYTMLNLFIYVFWWNKPQNVGCPIRVYKTSTAEHRMGGKEVDGWEGTALERLLEKAMIYFMGEQDEYVDHSQESSLPMFWAGRSDPGDGAMASAIVALLAAGFGAIHFIAWYSEFPSRAELILWRVACILLTVAPLTPWITVFLASMLDFTDTVLVVLFVFSLVPIPLYIASRAATLLIAFTALRSIPDAALVDVDWTTFIPHV
jgi:hypothetical protein